MAEELVRKEHFDEFARRMDERFDPANVLAEQRYDSINQRLADAEKTREQNLIHTSQRFGDLKEGINQRFDSLEKHMDQIHADMRQMRGWLIWLFGLAVFGFLGSIVLILFRDVL